MGKQMKYKIRIKGYADVPPDQLLANPKNFRLHPKHQQEVLSNVLSTVGVVQNVIVNETTGHVIDGHLRIALALRNDEPTVPVTLVELSPEEEDIIMASFDPIGALANSDKDKLEELLADIQTDNQVLSDFFAHSSADMGISDAPIDNPELQLEDKMYILVVELSSSEDYEAIKNELSLRGYSVKGNQRG
jgi:hypothetical protein